MKNQNIPLQLADFVVERDQCMDEGKDFSSLEAEFAAIKESDFALNDNLCRAEEFLDKTWELPVRADFPYQEPSDLEEIRAQRPQLPAIPDLVWDDAALLNKVLGGWQGRAAGCLLGKPVELVMQPKIEKYLKGQGRWPLSQYFSSRAPEGLAQECGISTALEDMFEEGITCMVEDDDTNYTVCGLALIKNSGADFTSVDVARFWLNNIPILHLYTAERTAYINFSLGIAPPVSATYRNVYREAIGAQIRGDFFGYVNPGNPVRAAEFAWRDACISHVKNGIYGEMWVAAMLAYAFVCDDVETVIRAGLAQIPAKSRLTAAIERIICLKHEGMSYEDVIADVHARWDENYYYKWVHTISNAEITAIALLWGEMDFEKTICYSVMPGFDTDCNGATAGSVLGVMLGADRLPAKWIAPMNDTLLTGVAGYYRVSLTQLAQESVDLMHIVRGA
jgi:ADP-ribosylglycohydrolase